MHTRLWPFSLELIHLLKSHPICLQKIHKKNMPPVGVRVDDVLVSIPTPSAGLEITEGHRKSIKNVKEKHCLVTGRPKAGFRLSFQSLDSLFFSSTSNILSTALL